MKNTESNPGKNLEKEISGRPQQEISETSTRKSLDKLLKDQPLTEQIPKGSLNEHQKKSWEKVQDKF